MRASVGITLALLVCGPSVGLANDFKASIVETFNENCSAIELELLTHNGDDRPTLEKGQRSKLLPLAAFVSSGPVVGFPPLPFGEMAWICGDTFEDSECDSGSTHVRVKRAAIGRSTKFTCYRIESCTEGTTTLDTLDDRCGEDMLKVGGHRIAFLETKENIPFSAANLNNSGGVRWYCGDSAERSNCPASTTLLTVERRDRDTRLFYIRCLRAGAECQAHYGPYPPD